jgi:NAD(P)-dependent dehydrogenase (short-subunit alcohol dehydrogenase family)
VGQSWVTQSRLLRRKSRLDRFDVNRWQRNWRPASFRVNAIAPGFIETDMTDELTPEQKEMLLKNIPLGRDSAKRTKSCRRYGFLGF